MPQANRIEGKDKDRFVGLNPRPVFPYAGQDNTKFVKLTRIDRGPGPNFLRMFFGSVMIQCGVNIALRKDFSATLEEHRT